MKTKLLVAGMIGVLAWLPQIALAGGPLFVNPAGGECIKGGTSYPISLTPSSGIHYALTYRTDGSTPPTYAANSSSYFAHPVEESWLWSVPAITSDSVWLWADRHDASHVSSILDSTQGSFSIDSSAPATPSLRLTGRSGDNATLAWDTVADAGCKGLEGYKLYNAGTGELIATLSTATTGYTVYGLAATQAYSYKLTAFDLFHSTDSTVLNVAATASSATPAPSATATATPTPSASATPSPTATPAATTTATAAPTSSYVATASADPGALLGLSGTDQQAGAAEQSATAVAHRRSLGLGITAGVLLFLAILTGVGYWLFSIGKLDGIIKRFRRSRP